MGAEFTPAFFSGNRERLRTLFTGTAPIILTANGLLQRNSDVTYPFRQDSTFWYLTGITEPDVLLVMDKGKEYLIIPERDERRVAFDGQVQNEHLTTVSGVETVLPATQGWKQLASRIKKVKHIATIAAPPSYIDAHGMYTNPARQHLIRRIKSHNSEIELLDLRTHIARLRSIKQPAEIDTIQSAIDLTADALKKLQRRGLDKYDTEYEVDAALTAHFRSNNATHAYQPIVAAGANACTLHYVQNSGHISPGNLLLIDVGAEVNHYAADITRTYAVGQPTRRMQQLYDTVLSVQEHAFGLLKPGLLMRDYEDQVQQYMGEKLRELGLIKSIDDGTVRRYYPHATSHFLGLDVHDIADYDKPLEPGMVLTVEPGIYVPEESIGIRIEDNIVIEPEGIRVLSDKLPRVLE